MRLRMLQTIPVLVFCGERTGVVTLETGEIFHAPDKLSEFLTRNGYAVPEMEAVA